MAELLIRTVSAADIDALAEMQHRAWHEYYKQYPFYAIISASVSLSGLKRDWSDFLGSSESGSSGLISGADRCAFLAELDSKIVGVGAASAYVEGKWPAVDQMLRRSDGSLPKIAKFQELYVDATVRGRGIGQHLSIKRADLMLERGYSGIFLTTYADAEKTNQFHLKNNLKRVHDYMSLQTFAAGQRVRIACFLSRDLNGYRDAIASALAKRGTSLK